jgi:hypothetical protein
LLDILKTSKKVIRSHLIPSLLDDDLSRDGECKRFDVLGTNPVNFTAISFSLKVYIYKFEYSLQKVNLNLPGVRTAYFGD